MFVLWDSVSEIRDRINFEDSKVCGSRFLKLCVKERIRLTPCLRTDLWR